MPKLTLHDMPRVAQAQMLAAQGKPNALALQDCLLSFIIHVRYTYTRMVFPIPTPSSACRIGIGREGNDL